MLKKISMLTLVCGLVFTPSIAFAQDASNSPVDTLKEEAAKVTGVYDDVLPVAIGSSVFAIAMIILKRVAFS